MFNYEFWGYKSFPGATTMALEEYMLKRAAQTGKAMIRFYSFPKDTIVLGYAQAPDILKDIRDVHVIRRPTGGSHVQTGKNILAYSFVAPKNGFSDFEDMRAYYAEHIANAFLSLGIIFPLGSISKVPLIPKGTTGTLAHKANLATPVFPS